MTDLTSDLDRRQAALARCLRLPGRAPLPEGMDPERVRMLQQMVFIDFKRMLTESFPRSADLLGADAWRPLIRRYMALHACRTPLFGEVAGEFVCWLQHQPALPHPALANLAHMEWAKVTLQQLDAPPLPPAAELDPLDVPLRRSPLAWPLVYRWPVQSTAPLDANSPPTQPTALLLQRDDAGRVAVGRVGDWAALLLIDIGQRPGLRGQVYMERLAQHCRQSLQDVSAPLHALLRQAWAQRTIGPATAG